MNNEHDESQDIISVLSDRILNGLFKENPTFVLLLGMCPTLAVTTSAANGLGMGVTTMVVLAMSNLIISALRKIIPNKVRIPAFIVIIASFVTIVELLLKAYIPSLYDALGIYIPLIVVNCIILGRAESYAYSHPVLPSLFDGIGMGMGFSVALTIIGGIREILGSGKLFGAMIMPAGFVPVSIFVMAPGAFFVLALLTAIQNVVKDIGTKKGHDMSKIQSGCGGNCMECDKECKSTGEAPLSVVQTVKPVKEKPVKEKTVKEKIVKEKPVKEKTVKEKTVKEKPVKEDMAEEPLEAKTKVQMPDVKAALSGFAGKIKGINSAKQKANAETDADSKDVSENGIEVKEEKPAKKTDSGEKSVKDKTVKEKPAKDKNLKEKPDKKPAKAKADKEAVKETAADKSKEAKKTEKVEKPAKIEKSLDSVSAEEEKTESVSEPVANIDEPEAPEQDKAEPVKAVRDVYKVDEASLAPTEDDEDELELIDLTSLRSSGTRSSATGKKPGRKTNTREKAKAMLFKAEESVKEDGND